MAATMGSAARGSAPPCGVHHIRASVVAPTPRAPAACLRALAGAGGAQWASPPAKGVSAGLPGARRRPQPTAATVYAGPESAATQISGQMNSWWQAYTRRLESDPVRTKAFTSFLGFMIGDFLAQRIGGEAFSPLRCLRLGAYGLFLDGPIGHWWYKLLDRSVMPDKPRSTSAVLIKTAADQLVWAPIMTVVFFAVLKSLEGHPELIWETVQDKLVKTVVANYILWPGAHFINFKFVPTEHRILYNNCVSVVWNAYLSTLSHAPEIDPAAMLENVQDTAAKLMPSELSLGPVELPPFERLLPEGAAWPNWFPKPGTGPITLAPFERLLPEGALPEWRLELPRRIQLAPTRALYPLWLHMSGGGGGAP